MHIDGACVARERIAPDALEQLVARENEATVVEQLPQEVELLGRELNFVVPDEHLAPTGWLYDGGEGYRRCCTSLAWVGEALAARLVGAQASWDHDAFFAYVDRWMDPTGDAAYTQTIFDMTGWDYRGAWAAQGQAWDALVEEMWAAHR